MNNNAINGTDYYLNRFIPNPRYERWPKCVSRWVGYRTGENKQQKPLSEIATLFWVMISSFVSMLILESIFRFDDTFRNRHVPTILPSWAASIILVFNAIDSPLAQPRNCFIGTMVSSVIGVCLTKLWLINPENNNYMWLCGALSVAISTVIMRLLNCLHPPAGAAALMPSVTPQVRDLGWYYLLVQLICGPLLLFIACLMNNIARRYPMYWWTPENLSSSLSTYNQRERRNEKELHGSFNKSSSSSFSDYEHCVIITANRCNLPGNIQLSIKTQEALVELQEQLANVDSIEH